MNILKNKIKIQTNNYGSWFYLQITLSSTPPLTAGKKLDANRDKKEAHLSLPHIHTKTTKAQEETHWVLKIVWYALRRLPADLCM